MKTAVLFIGAILILGFFNIAIYQKEAIIEKGQPVLLKLQPIDMQAMMENDSVHLRYSIEDEMRNLPPQDLESNTLAVIKIDEDSIAHFERLYTGELKDNEKLIKYYYQSLDPNPVHLKPDAISLQAGEDALFEKAYYAIFHYEGAKNYVLTGVADKEYNEITPPISE